VKDARQEVLEEIRKLKANIRYAQRAKKAAEKIRARVLERRAVEEAAGRETRAQEVAKGGRPQGS